MMTKAEKHKRAGTLDEFRARQAASRQGTLRYQDRMRSQREEKGLEPSLEERVERLEREMAELLGAKI